MKPIILTALAMSLTACATQASVPKTDAPGAYMIVSGKNYAAKDLGPYAASLPPIYEKYGGRYVAFSTDYAVMEGDVDAQALIISAWPSEDAAKTFWTSPEYREAIKLRDGIGEFDVVIVPAVPQR